MNNDLVYLNRRAAEERFAALNHGFLVFGSANAYPNENVILQNIECAAHAIRSPIGGVADAIHFFRRRSFFFLLLAQTLFLFLIALFLFYFPIVAPERFLPKIFWVPRIRRGGISVRGRRDTGRVGRSGARHPQTTDARE